MESFGASNLQDFLGKVSAKTPTPGGGSVAAVAAALASALGCMVQRYSVDKAPSDADRLLLERILVDLEKSKTYFLGVADRDAAAYDRVRDTRKMKKDTDADKSVRKAAVEHALREAAAVPLEGMRSAETLLRRLSELSPISNRMLSSDVVAALILGEGALRIFKANVLVNAADLPEESRTALTTEAEAVYSKAVACADEALAPVWQSLHKHTGK